MRLPGNGYGEEKNSGSDRITWGTPVFKGWYRKGDVHWGNGEKSLRGRRTRTGKYLENCSRDTAMFTKSNSIFLPLRQRESTIFQTLEDNQGYLTSFRQWNGRKSDGFSWIREKPETLWPLFLASVNKKIPERTIKCPSFPHTHWTCSVVEK